MTTVRDMVGIGLGGADLIFTETRRGERVLRKYLI